MLLVYREWLAKSGELKPGETVIVAPGVYAHCYVTNINGATGSYTRLSS